MYNIDQISGMNRENLISSLNDAEKCLIQVQQVLCKQNDFKLQKAKLLNECESLQKKNKRIAIQKRNYCNGNLDIVLHAFFLCDDCGHCSGDFV